MSAKSGAAVAGQSRALWMSTIAFTVCFAVWTIFAIIGIQIKKNLGLNETQFGLLVGTPILSGSLIRICARHLDRPIWWPHRLHSGDAGGSRRHLFPDLGHDLSAVSHRRAFRRHRRRLVCSRHRLRFALVSDRRSRAPLSAFSARAMSALRSRNSSRLSSSSPMAGRPSPRCGPPASRSWQSCSGFSRRRPGARCAPRAR